MVGAHECPIAHSATVLNGFFRALPERSNLTLLLESEDVLHALRPCESLVQHDIAIVENVSLPQWRGFIDTWQTRGIVEEYMKFDEDMDSDFNWVVDNMSEFPQLVLSFVNPRHLSIDWRKTLGV
jgi:hypothetical protein